MAEHDFGWAIARAKEGYRVHRLGWNGKNQWVAYMAPMVVPEALVNERTRKFIPKGDLNVCGYFVMFTEQGGWQCGWLASQADMLADDWEVFGGE